MWKSLKRLASLDLKKGELMPSQWVEGIDYSIERSEQGQETIKCLHCERSLKSKSALGPHLTVCTRKETKGETTTPSPFREEFDLDEKENFIEALKQFRVRNPEGLAAFVSGFGFDNLDVIDEALRLSDVDIGKRQLIVTRWSHHIQKPVTPTLLQRWSAPPSQVFPSQQAGQTSDILTKEGLEKLLDEREKRKQVEDRLRRLESEVMALRQGEGNPARKSEIQELKELLLKREQNEILARLSSLEKGLVSTSDPVVQLIKSAENILREIRGDIKPLKWYLLTGRVPSEPLPEKEVMEGATQGIFSRLPPKYISEE